METPIAIALISAGTTVILSLITLVQQLLTKRVIKDHVKEVKESVGTVTNNVIAVKEHVQEIKQDVATTKANLIQLEENTNGIKDALVKVTGEKFLAIGVKQGKAEEKAKEQAKKELGES